jgi:hypothetical protein
MPPHRNHELECQIESVLKAPLRSKDDHARLFCRLLGFEYTGSLPNKSSRFSPGPAISRD